MTSPRQVLVIDDEAERLTQLAEALSGQLPEVPIQTWLPVAGENPVERFQDHLSNTTELIVADHDLTKSVSGLLGSDITAWAQRRFIPVCNFSRKQQSSLPRASNFFELRVPTEPDEMARSSFIARIYRGFQGLREYMREHLAETSSPAALLAEAMGHPELQDELEPYITSVGSANSAFLQSLRDSDAMPKGEAQADFQVFILGHVLVNAVLDFPGPILSRRTLAAYCAYGAAAETELAALFSEAEYAGPFSAPGEYFIRQLVDDRIDELGAGQAADADAADLEVDQYNHRVVQQVIGEFAAHDCRRCGGTRGGLWCPFTKRPVCNREDCSVSSATWIPRGATLCRVEREYHDEWAPLLGE